MTYKNHPYWPVGAVRIGQFRVAPNEACDEPKNPMVRFAAICNVRFMRNETEAWRNYYDGKEYDKSVYCYTDRCAEYEYSNLEMGILG